MTNANSTLTLDQIELIQATDRSTQTDCDKIITLARALENLTDDFAVKSLASLIETMADVIRNDVNVMAEGLGANYINPGREDLETEYQAAATH